MAPAMRPTPLLSAPKLIHGRVGRRTTVSANRRARKNPVEQIYWRPGFYSRGSLTVVARWLYWYPVSKTNAGCPISQIAVSLRSIGRYDWLWRVPVLWKYDPGWEIEQRFGMGIWSSTGDFTRQPGTRNCPLHLPMPRSSQKIFIPAV